MTGTAKKVETEGVSPKALVAGLLPLAVGVVLLLLDKLVLGDTVDDSVWITLLLSSPLVAGGAAAASPGTVRIVEPVRLESSRASRTRRS